MEIPTTNRTIYGIGHSNHEWPAFVALLKKHGIDKLIDVRSVAHLALPALQRGCLAESAGGQVRALARPWRASSLQ